MLTPIEIQNKTFKSGGLGYDKKDVDQFVHDILNNYETIYRENMELNDKVSTLTQGIQYYKSIEKTIQKALVLAEKTAEDTKQAAMKNAKHIENDALTKSHLIVADAKNELDRIHNQTIQLIQQYEKYKAQFKSLAAAQIELLESESFAINVTRLDAFIKPELDAMPKKQSKTYNSREAGNKYKSNDDYKSDTNYKTNTNYNTDNIYKTGYTEDIYNTDNIYNNDNSNDINFLPEEQDDLNFIDID